MPAAIPPDAPVKTGGTFFRLLEIAASEAARYPDALEWIRQGDLHAVVLHDVFPPEVLRAVVDCFERHDPPFLKTSFPEKFRAFFYGENLNLADPDLRDYFREAAHFHQQLQSIFPPGMGVTDHLAKVLASLDGGRPFLAPPGPQPGEHYMFTTVRCHLPGGYIPPHLDNEQALRPSYRHLRTLVEPHMLSFVLAFTMPEAGGALEIFNYRSEPADGVLMNDDRAAARPDIGQLESVSLRLPPGAMIIVDSGRYLHRVSPVEGARNRWTACSFMALSRTRDAMYCWG